MRIKSKCLNVLFCMALLGCGVAQAAIDVGVPGCVIEYDFNNGDLVVDTASGDDLTAVIISDPNDVGLEPVLAPGVKGYCIDNTAIPQNAVTDIVLRVGIDGPTNSPMQEALNSLEDYVTITCWVYVDESFPDWTHMFYWDNKLVIAWVDYLSANRTFLRKDGGNSGPATSHPPTVEYHEMNQWMFMAVSYNGSMTSGINVDWYKGWVDAESVRRSGEILYKLDVLDSDAKVAFFNHTLDSGIRGCSIKMDEFRVFNRILSAAEIEAVRVFDLTPGAASVCGDVNHPAPSEMDFDEDCIVGLSDFAVFAADWLLATPMP